MKEHRDTLRATVEKLRKEGKTIFGLGASTKGNVTLQYWSTWAPIDLPASPRSALDKFGGNLPPGTLIPIAVRETEA